MRKKVWHGLKNVTFLKIYINGSPSISGNACKILLDNVDTLRSNQNLGSLKYVQCFQDFRDVVNFGFTNTLDPKLNDHIQKFHKSYVDLKISITPIVHAVIIM